MKNSYLLLVAMLMYSCFAHAQHAKHQGTPKIYKVTQKEKDNHNFDLKQSKKIIAENIKHKRTNEKAAEKKRLADNEAAIELNSAAKVKKDKKSNDQAFSFYH